MKKALLTMIAAILIGIITFMCGYNPDDLATLKRTMKHQDHQAYQDRLLLDDYKQKTTGGHHE